MRAPAVRVFIRSRMTTALSATSTPPRTRYWHVIGLNGLNTHHPEELFIVWPHRPGLSLIRRYITSPDPKCFTPHLIDEISEDDYNHLKQARM